MKKLTLEGIDKSNWEVFPFEKIAKRIAETVDPNKTDLNIYYGLEHLDADSIHIRRNGTPGDVSGGKLKCYPGDVIFGKRRAYQRKAGIVTQAAICSAHSFVFRANEEIMDVKLFPFFLHSDQFMHRMIDISVGGLSPTINWSDLKHQEFLLPPKTQQAELAELLLAMDELIEKDLLVREKLNDLFLAKEQLYFNTKKEDRISKRLEEVADISGGSTPLTTSSQFWNGEIPWLTPSDITNYKGIYFDNPKNYITEEGLKSISNKLYPKNSILFCSRASIGEAVINKIPMATNQGFTNLIVKKNINVEYIYFYLKSLTNALKKIASGTTFLEISKRSFRIFKISIHTKDNQEKIAKELSDLFNIELDIDNKIQTSRSLHKAIINELF